MVQASPVPLRVLVVARWYPSHDQPGRGSFVADLVGAVRAIGVDVVVASFEATHVRGIAATRAERAADAARAIGASATGPSARNRPRSWGVPGVPVARLPVFLDGERRRPSDVADAHDAALRPFAVALAERWPFDVIHAHTGLVDGVVAARLADAAALPLLVTEHSSTVTDELADPDAAGLYRPLLRQPRETSPARRLVAVSRSLAAAVADALDVDSAEISALPNAVPIDGFPIGDPAARAPDELLYVGSRKASKGIERLLRAVALARTSRPALRLRMVGTPGSVDEEATWERLVGELSLGDAVTIEPAASRPAVSAAMRQATLFVHPSPRETFGVVVAEALASGLPVATTPSGGGDEIVGDDGRFGVVARGFEAQDLAAAILEALEPGRSFDAAAMRAHIDERYAAAGVGARTVETYRELVAASRRAVPSEGRAVGPGPAVAIPPAPRDTRPAAVVALARGQAVQRFNQLPPALRRATTVITLPPAPTGLNAAALPADGRWLEFDAAGGVHEALAAAGEPRNVRGGPLGLLDEQHNRRVREERARVERDRDEITRAWARRTLRGAVSENGWLVALDADDVLACEPALGDGVDLAPGGLRWLADRADEAAAGRPEETAGERTDGAPRT